MNVAGHQIHRHITSTLIGGSILLITDISTHHGTITTTEQVINNLVTLDQYISLWYRCSVTTAIDILDTRIVAAFNHDLCLRTSCSFCRIRYSGFIRSLITAAIYSIHIIQRIELLVNRIGCRCDRTNLFACQTGLSRRRQTTQNTFRIGNGSSSTCCYTCNSFFWCNDITILILPVCCINQPLQIILIPLIT